MNVVPFFRRETGGEVEVRYTTEDIQGWFVDAMDAPEMKGAQIDGFFRFGPNKEHMGATIRNFRTGIVAEYGMNVAARKPYMIRIVRTCPIDKKRKVRPWGSKDWRARKGWENR